METFLSGVCVRITERKRLRLSRVTLSVCSSAYVEAEDGQRFTAFQSKCHKVLISGYLTQLRAFMSLVTAYRWGCVCVL